MLAIFVIGTNQIHKCKLKHLDSHQNFCNYGDKAQNSVIKFKFIYYTTEELFKS